MLTNKTNDKDLKVWYRFIPGPQGEAGLNVALPASWRKAYVNAKAARATQLLVKVDPTQPYFIKSIEDMKVELDVTIRNGGGGAQDRGQRRVHYAATTSTTVAVGAQSNHDLDEDDVGDRDDDEGYNNYQGDGQYPGYEGPGAGLLLQAQPAAEGADGDRRSNDSTNAVQDGNNVGVSRENSAGDLGDLE